MMTNRDVVKAFLIGETGQGRSLLSDGCTLSTDGEPIAARVNDGREVTIYTARMVCGRLAARHRSIVLDMASHVRKADDLRDLSL